MRLYRVLEGIGVIDVDFDNSPAHHVEQLISIGQQICALGDVGAKCRPRGIERALGGELQDIRNW